MVPKRVSKASYPEIAPGTVAELMPVPGTLSTPSCCLKYSGVQSAGAQPAEFRAYNFLSRALQTRAKRSPAMPVSFCEVTSSTAAAATAASMALPPCRRISKPACAASGSLVATMPWRAITSERPCPSQPWPREPGAATIFAAGLGVFSVGTPNGFADWALTRLLPTAKPTTAAVRSDLRTIEVLVLSILIT